MRWHRSTGGNDLLAMSGDGSQAAMSEYVAYYRHINPHINRYPELMVPGNVTVGMRGCVVIRLLL